MRDDLAILFAHGNAPGVRRTHHDAFEHGLAADQRFFGAFERGKELEDGLESQYLAQRTHRHWMSFGQERTMQELPSRLTLVATYQFGTVLKTLVLSGLADGFGESDVRRMHPM